MKQLFPTDVVHQLQRHVQMIHHLCDYEPTVTGTFDMASGEFSVSGPVSDAGGKVAGATGSLSLDGHTRPVNKQRDVRNKVIPSPDGRRFLMLSPRAIEGPIELRIVLNWFLELGRLALHPPR